MSTVLADFAPAPVELTAAGCAALDATRGEHAMLLALDATLTAARLAQACASREIAGQLADALSEQAHEALGFELADRLLVLTWERPDLDVPAAIELLDGGSR